VTPLYIVLLVVTGVAGGFVDTVAGGGSLIMVPALMLLGLPASMANATSRVAVLAQSTTSAVSFAKNGRLDLASALDVVPSTVVGAIAGAYVATVIPARVFQPLLVATMLATAFLLFARPETLAPPAGTPRQRATGRPFAMLALCGCGFYGGLLQGGVGIVLISVLGGMLRYDLIRGNALKGLIVAIYTVPVLAVFVAHGMVSWVPALVLAVGNSIGAQLAVMFAVKQGQDAVRKLVVAVVIVSSAYILARPYL
jgi:uncharacterized membrane protein YfcA